MVLGVRFKDTTIPSITYTERISYRCWYVFCPPLNEDNSRKAPLFEIDLNAHLIRMWSGGYVFRKSMQDEIQVRPGEVPEQRWHYADGAEMAGLVVVVVTVRNV